MQTYHPQGSLFDLNCRVNWSEMEQTMIVHSILSGIEEKQ